jgi:PAS domain S-box-containing protein
MVMLKNFKKNIGETARIVALDTVRANVMIADSELNIIHMNASVINLMREVEDDFKKELPGFNVAALIGRNIDVFHKNPDLQRKMLATSEKSCNATIPIGKRVFDLAVSPIYDRGRKTGFVVEWTDARERLLNLNYAAQFAAVNKSQAVIEFTVNGDILSANENFLKAMGYDLDEIQGKHHGMFVEPDYRNSLDYARFWERLRAGEFQAGQYKRIGKHGRQVWIEGAYNPIFDQTGKVSKVVKFATDITAQMDLLANLKTLIDQNFGEIDGAVERSATEARSASVAADETSSNVQMVAASFDQRDLTEHGEVPLGHRQRLRLGSGGRAEHGETDERRPGDERHRRIDPEHRGPDQPAGAERHHRGRPRRRGGQGLRGGGFGGQEPCQSGGQGDRADIEGNRRRPVNLGRGRDGALYHS